MRDVDGYDSDNYDYYLDPDPPDEYEDLHTFWNCVVCGAQNSSYDGECQDCDCGGLECKRDSCSEPEHFHAEHVSEEEPVEFCSLCRKEGKA